MIASRNGLGLAARPICSCAFCVYNDPTRAASFLEPFVNHVHSYGLGTAGEIS